MAVGVTDVLAGTGWQVADLATRADCLPALSRLLESVWPDWYGPGGQGRAEADLAARCRRAGLPFGVVALARDGAVGTGALDTTSYGASDPTETPWIVGLVVAPPWRGQGIATAIVAALEDAARAKGWARLHCATVAGEGLLSRRGWVRRGVADDGRHGLWTHSL
jgi:GNAT superfamily N-acetyltransferase